MNRIYKVLMAVVLPVLCSCEHKELCLNHSHTVTVTVEFDWQNAPDASPEGMCVYFYPQDADGSVERYDFIGATGGEVKLPTGTYNVICHNNDTEGVLFSGAGSYDTYTAYTRDDSGERTVINPDMMWCASAQDFEVQFTDSDNVITLHPEQVVCTYTFEVLNVQNLKYAVQITGTLSGMASQISLSTAEPGTECVRVPFEGRGDGESGITGEFLTFGHNEDNTEPHNMTFCVEITDGSKHYYTYDVTEQVDGAADRKNVHITVDGMDLPTPIADGDGFDPSVDDWQGDDFDIQM